MRDPTPPAQRSVHFWIAVTAENNLKDGIEEIGLIAGSRSLPLLFAQEARRHGIRRIVAVAAKGETSPDLANLVDDIVWLQVGQLGKMLKAFRDRGVRHCVMLGQIQPRRLFDLRPDWRAFNLLRRVRERTAHTLFTAIAQELQDEGVTLIEPTPWLQDYMPDPGIQKGPPVSPARQADVEMGHRMAKEVSHLDIGQCVVVKNGTLLAVEAFEGTDACLRRGGELAGKKGGAVAVKVAKADHDMRFDIPCIGRQTLETCLASGIDVLAVEGHKTLLLDQTEWPKISGSHRLTFLTV